MAGRWRGLGAPPQAGLLPAALSFLYALCPWARGSRLENTWGKSKARAAERRFRRNASRRPQDGSRRPKRVLAGSAIRVPGRDIGRGKEGRMAGVNGLLACAAADAVRPLITARRRTVQERGETGCGMAGRWRGSGAPPTSRVYYPAALSPILFLPRFPGPGVLTMRTLGGKARPVPQSVDSATTPSGRLRTTPGGLGASWPGVRFVSRVETSGGGEGGGRSPRAASRVVFGVDLDVAFRQVAGPDRSLAGRDAQVQADHDVGPAHLG